MNNIYEIATYDDPHFPIKFVKRKKPTDFVTYIHWHENIELLYFISGKGIVINNDETVKVTPGASAFICPNNFHDVRALDDNFIYYYFSIGSDFLEDFGFDLDGLSVPTITTDPYVTGKYEKIISALEEKQDNYKISVKIDFLSIILYIFNKYKKNNTISDFKSNKYDIAKQGISYMKKNFTNHISIDEIASNLGISKYYFCHIFKEVTDRTPIYYLNYLRCSNAKRMLSDKNLNINEICDKCGFEVPSYFTKTFKKFYNCTPSEYKKKVKDFNTKKAR